MHIRDISHPNTEYQKHTVIDVLKEIGIDNELLTSGYVEVWNKLDLCSDEAIENHILPN
jgi:GTPase